jgi:PAS domain S-box-containing protein
MAVKISSKKGTGRERNSRRKGAPARQTIGVKKSREKSLSLDEEKYRTILANMEEGYYETDLEGNFTLVNPATCRNLCRNESELLGMNYRHYIAPQSTRETEAIFQQVYRTGKAAKIFECELIIKDGTRRIHEMSVSLLRQPSGDPMGFFGISRDRTDRLQLERALRESEESYRGVMDLCPDTISIIEVETSRCVDINEAFLRQTGYSAAEVIGRTPTELDLFASPEERQRLDHALRQGRIDSLEVRFRTKDGTILENLVSGRQIQFKGKACFLFVATLITPLKEAQTALRESEESYRRVLELAPDAITISRLADGKYFEVNEAFCQQTGFDRDQVIGRTVMDLNLYADPEDRKQLVAAIRQRGRVDGMEIRFRAKDGTLLTDLVSARVISFKNEECVLIVATVINALKEAQKALVESEKRYRTILEAAPDSICLTRLSDGKYIEANSAFYQRTGFTAEETIGHTSSDLDIYVDPADRDRLIKALKQSDQVDGFEVPVKSKHGAISHNLWSCRMIQHNNEPCLLVVAKEIDELKRAQRALAESEESYRAILDTVPYSVTISRISDGRYLLVNKAFSRNTGHSAEETIGRTARELKLYENPTDRRQFLEAYQRQGSVDGMEIRFQRKDGTVTTSLMSARAITFKGKQCVLGVSTNIDALKEVQKALEESEEGYRRILESAPYSIIITRLSDGHYMQVNEAFCKRTGFSREEAIGHTPNELNIFFDPNARKRMLETFRNKGRVDGMELQFRSKDGRILDSLFSVTPFTYHGEDCMLAMTVDISERKRVEQELERYRQHLEEMVRTRTQALEAAQNELVKSEKLAVLGQLTATVSHELRNPLGVIRSSNFYLQRKVKDRDEKVDKHFKRIEEQVALCDTIVADLLEYTRGRNVSMVKEDITPWLAQVIEQIQEAQGITVTKELSTQLPAVPHDQEKMRRVVINVIDNAIQAVRAKSVAANGGSVDYHPNIKIKTHHVHDQVILSIADNGVGMDPDTLQRAFEPLFTTRARGTGIGLAIVKKIVNEHGGSVSLESDVGEGTRVTIALPCAVAPKTGTGP